MSKLHLIISTFFYFVKLMMLFLYLYVLPLFLRQRDSVMIGMYPHGIAT